MQLGVKENSVLAQGRQGESTITKGSKNNYDFSATVSDFGWSLPHSSSLGGVVLPETAMVCGYLR